MEQKPQGAFDGETDLPRILSPDEVQAREEKRVADEENRKNLENTLFPIFREKWPEKDGGVLKAMIAEYQTWPEEKQNNFRAKFTPTADANELASFFGE
jgi:hypothetical protein